MRCVFLDRDGTICIDKTYNNRVEDLQFTVPQESLIYNLHRIKRLGFYIIVISNQGGVSLGYSTEQDVINFNNELNRRLSYLIDDFFFCPHKKEDGCECRKPKVGLIKKAMSKYKIDLELSWFIGDKSIDIETGKNAGLKTILVMTGHGRNEVVNADPDFVSEDINQAVNIIERIVLKEIKVIYGVADKFSVQGVIDQKIRGKFSKVFESIDVCGVVQSDFAVEPTLPLDFIISEI